jgi:uncharacterized protein (DUF983 family)
MSESKVMPQCDGARAILARVDANELDRRRALAHQQTCPHCASEKSLVDMLSTLTNSEATDLSAADRVHAQLSTKRPTVTLAIVGALIVGSALQAAIALPWLVGANPFSHIVGVASDEHLTRDGAIGVVISVAGFVVAWRPRYAFAMLALVAATTGMQILGGFVDAPEHTSGIPFEFVHAIVLAIALLIVLVALRRDRGFGPLRSSR